MLLLFNKHSIIRLWCNGTENETIEAEWVNEIVSRSAHGGEYKTDFGVYFKTQAVFISG